MISFRATGTREFLAASRRTREALLDWRPFWRRWRATGDLARIQREWFQTRGPDTRPLRQLTVKKRFAGLRETRRSSPDFYKALKAGNGSSPTQIDVSSSGPRWVWTKNTLRSTFLDPIEERLVWKVIPERFQRLHQKGTYKRFGGPFTHSMPNPKRIWDLREIAKSLRKHVNRHLEQAAQGAAA